MSKKLKLPFVNNGKPFKLEPWTVAKHEAALKDLGENCSDLSSDEQERQFKFYVIKQGLKSVDDSVTMEDIKNLHPENVVALFEAIYTEGKVDIFFEETASKKK